jgi:hypothetical protein
MSSTLRNHRSVDIRLPVANSALPIYRPDLELSVHIFEFPDHRTADISQVNPAAIVHIDRKQFTHATSASMTDAEPIVPTIPQQHSKATLVPADFAVFSQFEKDEVKLIGVETACHTHPNHTELMVSSFIEFSAESEDSYDPASYEALVVRNNAELREITRRAMWRCL